MKKSFQLFAQILDKLGRLLAAIVAFYILALGSAYAINKAKHVYTSGEEISYLMEFCKMPHDEAIQFYEENPVKVKIMADEKNKACPYPYPIRSDEMPNPFRLI